MTTPSATGLELLPDGALQAALEDHLAPRLAARLRGHSDGHCMRCDDLDAGLAARLTRRLRAMTPAAVHVLGSPPDVAADVAASSTKIVELRNPGAGGVLRPPLLVLVPPGTRASAEDSFGVATFERILLGSAYDDLAAALHGALGDDLARAVRELLSVLADEKWPVDGPARCRFLLTVVHHDQDLAAAGAAVCELGLIPDPELFTTTVAPRAARNVRIVEQIAASTRPDRQRVLGLGLTDADFRRDLAAFAADVGLDDPVRWTRAVVADRDNWRFFFGRWPLREDTTYDEIGIEVGELDLPVAGDEEGPGHPTLRGITGQRFLPAGVGGRNELVVPFRLDRDPRQVSGLVRFRVQLMAEHADGDQTTATPTQAATTVKVSSTGKLAYQPKLRKLTSAGLEEDWHYVRVTAVDADGLPIGHRGGDERTGPDARAPYESDRFYVLPDGEHDIAPAPQRSLRADGATHAARDLAFAALADGQEPTGVRYAGARWQDPPRGSAATGPRTLVCDFGPVGLVEVAVSPHLMELEQRILGDPDTVTHWELGLAVTDSSAALGCATAAASRWTEHLDVGLVATFREARRALFEAVARPAGAPQANGPLFPVEATDLLALREEIVRYVDSYAALLDQRHVLAAAAGGTPPASLADLARVDTVAVTLTDHRDAVHDVVLVAPTHPTRLLWLLAWALVGHSWAAEGRSADAAAARRTLFGLRPLGHPLVLPRPGGRMGLAAADLTPYWSVFLPDATPDPQGLVGLVATALGVPVRSTASDVWSGRALAERLDLYLRHHPYVRTLLVNAVNVGRGEEIAHAVELLRDRPDTPAVEVDLRLYVGDPEAPGSASAVLDLLDDPNGAGGLTVAIRERTEFRDPDDDAAHLTVLYDALSAENLGTAILDPRTRRSLPVHGLVQEMPVEYVDDADGPTVWRKRPLHGAGWELTGAEDVTDLLSVVPAALSSLCAALATGEFADGQVPEVSLTLSTADSALLDHAHRCSDWVVTVDRTLGVEFFDTPSGDHRPDHVIDHAPESTTALGHHMVVSSRSLDELRALLVPILAENHLSVADRHVRTFFDQLRLLSGRLAFKIASVARNQRTEVLGLAVARLFLDRRGALRNQVLVPLDAHLELYGEARRGGADLRRTDLALFDLDAVSRTITCRLVEVKCHATDGGISGYQRLKDGIREQTARSAEVLATHFDPARARPDRVAKNFELSTLLRFYLERGRRHAVIGRAADGIAELLDGLDAGYQLAFTRSGLIIDLAGRGTDVDVEGGVEFTRIGRDVVQDLLDAVPTGPVPQPPRAAPSSTTPAVDLTRRPRAAYDSAPRRRAARRPDDAPASPADSSPSPTLEADAAGPAHAGLSSDDDSPPVEPTDTQPEQPVAEAEAGSEPDPAPDREPDVIVGTSRPTPQYGVLGETSPDKIVAIDLDETHTVSLFGVQGGGKSYTLGSIIESATLPAAPVNRLTAPLATIVFHYSATQDYAPEFTSMAAPNDDAATATHLADRYGVTPRALQDIILLAPRDKCDQRRIEYPDLDVRPLLFSSGELQIAHWLFLMGAVGNQATYIRQLKRLMREHRDDLRLDTLRTAVEASSMADHVKQLATERLDIAGDYIDDAAPIRDLVTPGRLLIVDLRDELIGKDEALGLFVVLMQLFAEARGERAFNKLVVFDEAHKYIDSPDLVKGLVESVREMRHKGMSVLVASQDPPSVPVSLIELSDHIIVHKFTSPAWLRHLQKANAALTTMTAERLAELRPGEAYLWASKSTDPTFTERLVKIRTRPRLTRHGGATRRATDR